MRKKKLIIVLTMLTTILLISGCSKEKDINEELLNINYKTKSNEAELTKYETENPVIAMYIKNYGSIVIELYPEVAPNTVNNFISLVKTGFYDNNTFHRLVPGFVLQGGDPTGTGTGGPNYRIKGEFKSNNIENNLKHKKWVVSMARSNSYDSAGSQFFIMLGDYESLDGDYAAFGKIIDGKETIKKIENNENIEDDSTGKLKTNLIIKKAVIDLKGKTYNDVEKITD